jgi:hypothetical protein
MEADEEPGPPSRKRKLIGVSKGHSMRIGMDSLVASCQQCSPGSIPGRLPLTLPPPLSPKPSVVRLSVKCGGVTEARLSGSEARWWEEAELLHSRSFFFLWNMPTDYIFRNYEKNGLCTKEKKRQNIKEQNQATLDRTKSSFAGRP